MKKITTPHANEQIIDTVIELAHCSKRQRILLAGSKAPDRLSDFHRRGFNRVMTTAICGLRRDQYDVAVVGQPGISIKALETTLDWLVHFLAPAGLLVVWVESCADPCQLVSVLERLGFRIEVGTSCQSGFAVAARKRGLTDTAEAA